MNKVYITNGQNGGITVADTVPHPCLGTSAYGCITPVTDTVFSALAGNMTGWAGFTYPAGIPIFGVFTNFTLASGSVTAYFR